MGSDRQLDLFSGPAVTPAGPAQPAEIRPDRTAAELDDEALLAALPVSGVALGPSLATEAGRRRLIAAIPILEAYCRRFAGFGTQHMLPEQAAALEALAAIGGPDAARSVADIIARGWVQGPTMATAVAAAVRLRAHLPTHIVLALLRHADPAIRRDACQLARPGPAAIAILLDLLDDLHQEVCMEAACALARMGRKEAAPLLKRALRQAPSPRVVEAVLPVADEECLVLLGRLARESPDLAAAARDVLEAVEHPLASRLLERLPRG